VLHGLLIDAYDQDTDGDLPDLRRVATAIGESEVAMIGRCSGENDILATGECGGGGSGNCGRDRLW